MTAIILWLSRHTPTPRQLAELERIYPGHILKIDRRSFDGADDIVERYHKSGATDMVVVAPLSFVRELVRRGLHPLWAEMRQVTRGSPLAESHNNGRSYKFIGFRRITAIKVDTIAANPLTSPFDKKEGIKSKSTSVVSDTPQGCDLPDTDRVVNSSHKDESHNNVYKAIKKEIQNV